VSDAVDADLSGCTRYPHRDDPGKEIFWTAGQRYDLVNKLSSFVWKYSVEIGSCCNSMCSDLKFHAILLAWKPVSVA